MNKISIIGTTFGSGPKDRRNYLAYGDISQNTAAQDAMLMINGNINLAVDIKNVYLSSSSPCRIVIEDSRLGNITIEFVGDGIIYAYKELSDGRFFEAFADDHGWRIDDPRTRLEDFTNKVWEAYEKTPNKHLTGKIKVIGCHAVDDEEKVSTFDAEKTDLHRMWKEIDELRHNLDVVFVYNEKEDEIY